MPKKYRVTLTPAERVLLQDLLRKGTAPARTLTHARLLLKADEGVEGPAWTDAALVAALEVSLSTVSRTRQRFSAGGLTAALHRKELARRPEAKLDGAQEAHLIALACSPAPAGRDRWTLRLLAERYVALGHVDDVSHETVRQVLKRGNSSRGASNNGASPRSRAARS
jgi:transposase